MDYENELKNHQRPEIKQSSKTQKVQTAATKTNEYKNKLRSSWILEIFTKSIPLEHFSILYQVLYQSMIYATYKAYIGPIWYTNFMLIYSKRMFKFKIDKRVRTWNIFKYLEICLRQFEWFNSIISRFCLFHSN